ncbi:MAG TPA: hypothetical protein VNB24_09055 [Acidimicrobiales bacterium]|nr:hypothetical protein [Acidimicrobiales bacterium]
MSSKWSVVDVVRDHYETFVDAESGQWLLRDYVGMVAVPIGLGGLVAWRDPSLAGAGAMLSGVGIFTAGLFGLLLQVFSLATRVVDDPRLAGQTRLSRLVDELETNVSYAVVVGLMTTAALMVANSWHQLPSAQARWGNGFLVALIVHLVLTVFMAIKRTRAVYRKMRGL